MKLKLEIIKEINLALSVSLLSLLILESLWPGLVLAYIKLNYWLILWLLSVILLLFSFNSSPDLHDRINH